MTSSIQHRCVAAVAVLAASLVASAPAPALRFTSDLSSIKIEARPGQVVTRSFQLRLAPEETRVQFRSRMEDFWQSEDGKQSFYRAAGTLDRSCASWISLNPVEQAVEGGGELDIRLTVAVPDDVEAGGHWCALTVDQVADPLAAPAGIGVQFLASISIGVFVYVPPVERAARILDVRFDGDEASVRIANEGNAPIAVEGRFELSPAGGGEPIAVVPLPRTTVLLEPIASRWISVTLPDRSRLPSGRYQARVILDIGTDHYLGVQKEIDLRRGPERQPQP